jgi:hypothetical protein
MPGCPSVIHITRLSLRKREWSSQGSHYYVCLARNNRIRTTEFSSLFNHSHVVYELSCFRMHCHISWLSDWYLILIYCFSNELNLYKIIKITGLQSITCTVGHVTRTWKPSGPSPFLLLYNPILFQNDNNPPEIFLMKKIIYIGTCWNCPCLRILLI